MNLNSKIEDEKTKWNSKYSNKKLRPKCERQIEIQAQKLIMKRRLKILNKS